MAPPEHLTPKLDVSAMWRGFALTSPARLCYCATARVGRKRTVIHVSGRGGSSQISKGSRLRSTAAELSAGSAHPRQLRGGQLLSAISTGIVKLVREHYGRGPIKAKTYALDDIIVCVLREVGFTPLEKTIMDSGEPKRIVAMREDFQRLMASRYKELIEELTGRKVLAFLSQAHVEPDITLEMFYIDHPLDALGAVEAIDGGTSESLDPLRSWSGHVP